MATYSGVYQHFEGTDLQCSGVQLNREFTWASDIGTEGAVRYLDCSGDIHYLFPGSGSTSSDGFWVEKTWGTANEIIPSGTNGNLNINIPYDNYLYFGEDTGFQRGDLCFQGFDYWGQESYTSFRHGHANGDTGYFVIDHLGSGALQIIHRGFLNPGSYEGQIMITSAQGAVNFNDTLVCITDNSLYFTWDGEDLLSTKRASIAYDHIEDEMFNIQSNTSITMSADSGDMLITANDIVKISGALGSYSGANPTIELHYFSGDGGIGFYNEQIGLFGNIYAQGGATGSMVINSTFDLLLQPYGMLLYPTMPSGVGNAYSYGALYYDSNYFVKINLP
jgi:hypothetical protein